jgi:uncharacterized protein YceH (UPF0502 family)
MSGDLELRVIALEAQVASLRAKLSGGARPAHVGREPGEEG